MANVNLADVITKDSITKKDILNLEVIHGKFNLSYRSSLSAFSNFFLSSSDLTAMTKNIDTYCVWLDHKVRDGANDSLMDKEEMENKFLFLSEAKYYYKRLLTHEVMEEVCSEYATAQMLSAMIDDCRTKGQYVATELANALSWQASIVKTTAIMNDTNIQLNSLDIESMLDTATVLGDTIGSLANQIAELQSQMEGLEAGGGEAGGGGGGGGGGSDNSKVLTLSFKGVGKNGVKYYVVNINGKGWFTIAESQKADTKTKYEKKGYICKW